MRPKVWGGEGRNDTEDIGKEGGGEPHFLVCYFATDNLTIDLYENNALFVRPALFGGIS